MSKTYRLNDLQLVLLSTAAAREHGSLIPLPDSQANDTERVRKAIASLLRRNLIEESPVINVKLAWREEDQERIGLFISAEGQSAIGADASGEQEATENGQDDTGRDTTTKSRAADEKEDGEAVEAETDFSEHSSDEKDVASRSPTSHPRPGSKIASVIALLERDQGATLDEMVAATDWQPHTTRAALTGLRKRGYAIDRSKRDDTTCYRIVEVA